MSSFEDRERMSLDNARTAAHSGPRVTHVLSNDDGTYSVMMHIVCEFCDYCADQGDCRGRPWLEPVPAKADPYEKVG